ncbi:uncharacterized protein LOC105699306 [Orussus abietinus]|uniref:uncharacterized protein LOC105699306 n=1 Tax=Orussus abietinus TaxID=222816 RepID=UPI000625FC83|nr:uncharacterized protein LOC105699306 [Orussus abietinus]
MAGPGLGKCVVLLVVGLLVYAGFAFRVREAEQARCVGPPGAKCRQRGASVPEAEEGRGRVARSSGLEQEDVRPGVGGGVVRGQPPVARKACHGEDCGGAQRGGPLRAVSYGVKVGGHGGAGVRVEDGPEEASDGGDDSDEDDGVTIEDDDGDDNDDDENGDDDKEGSDDDDEGDEATGDVDDSDSEDVADEGSEDEGVESDDDGDEDEGDDEDDVDDDDDDRDRTEESQAGDEDDSGKSGEKEDDEDDDEDDSEDREEDDDEAPKKADVRKEKSKPEPRRTPLKRHVDSKDEKMTRTVRKVADDSEDDDEEDEEDEDDEDDASKRRAPRKDDKEVEDSSGSFFSYFTTMLPDSKSDEDAPKPTTPTKPTKVLRTVEKMVKPVEEKKTSKTPEKPAKLEETPVKKEAPLRKLEKVHVANKDKPPEASIAPKRPPETTKTKEIVQKVEEKPKSLPGKVEEQMPSTQSKPKEAPKQPEKPKPKETLKQPEVPKPKETPKQPETPKPKQPEVPKPKQPEVPKPKQPEVPKPKQPEAKSILKTTPKTEAKQPQKREAEAKPKPKPKPKSSEASISLAELNEAILHVPTFIPNFTDVEDSVCRQHGMIFLRQLRGYKLWALQMLDSSAKIPAGLLRGNTNQLGDFDQCVGVAARVKIDEKTVKVQGKYCLATVDVHATRPDTKIPVNLMQSRAFVRGSMRDPGHFIPRFTTINWGLCLPAACSAEDARATMEASLRDYNGSSGLRFTFGVDPKMCYTKQKPQGYSKETIGVLYFYAVAVCLVFVATLRDHCLTLEGKGTYSERIIMAFSLKRTTKTLMQTDAEVTDEISCIHGIRAISTVVLYVAHRLIPISRIPFANRARLTEVANSPLTSVLRVSLVYTDCFLLLSGVLSAYNMAKDLKNRGEIRWFCRFVARYIRLTPALVVVVFWYGYVMEHIGNGPQWHSVITTNADLCKKNFWTNLLYIQNFFPFEEMCATHTHQLALDMQLSLLAPMLVFFLFCRPVLGILVIFFLLQLSATFRYFATMNNSLSLVIFHGMTARHLYKTANMTYALSLHRATPYLFGVGLGVLLQYTGRNLKIHKALVVTGWIIALALGSWSLFSPWKLARRDYVYDAEEATHYAVISPVSWALALCWLIFACFTNNGGFLNDLLSSHWLVVFSRISYAVYLTQFAVFFYNVGTTRYSTEFNIYSIIDPLEFGTVIAFSIVLTLLFDIPMQEVKSVIMECTDGLVMGPSGEKGPEEEEEETKNGPKEFAEDEIDSTGWDWQKDIKGGTKEDLEDPEEEAPRIVFKSKRQDPRRMSFIAYDREDALSWDVSRRPRGRTPEDEDEEVVGKGRSRSNQRAPPEDYSDEDERESRWIQQERESRARREKRSESRGVEIRISSPSEDEEVPPRSERPPSRTRSSLESRRPYSRELEDSKNRQVHRRERSESRGRMPAPRDPEETPSWEFVRRERSVSRGPESNRSSVKSTESQQSRSPRLSRSVEPRRTVSSGSEEETSSRRRPRVERKQSSEEPRVSDEENWEQELKLRERRLAEKLSREHEARPEEDHWNLRRRSSAEGKIALLKDTDEISGLDTWTISRVPRGPPQGSSLEPSEPEDEDPYSPRERSYREKGPPLREDVQGEETWEPEARRRSLTGSQITSTEDDDDVSTYDFVLKKESKKVSLRDLSRLSREEPEIEEEMEEEMDSGWNLVREEISESTPRPPSGLFKRESIIKSQASEEDPEFLLPERPKLMEQEQEHPFKKAWQLQKSRSEEDGSSGLTGKSEDKQHPEGASSSRKEEGEKRKPAGGQSTDEDVAGEEVGVAEVARPDPEEASSRSRSSTEERSSNLEGSTDDDQSSSAQHQRRRFRETSWNWEQEET